MTLHRSVRSIRVVVVADQPLMAESVRGALAGRGIDDNEARWPDHHRRGRISASRNAGLVITDLEDAEQLRATEVMLALPTVPWAVLTSAPRGWMWGALIEAGATQVMPKSSTLDDVVETLSALSSGDAPMPVSERLELAESWFSRVHRRDLVAARVGRLTPREQEVLDQLYQGHPVADIADTLDLSAATVRTQVRSILKKLEVRTQLGAVAALDLVKGFADNGQIGPRKFVQA